MLLLLALFILAACSFWATHRSAASIADRTQAQNDRIDLRTWFQNGGGGGGGGGKPKPVDGQAGSGSKDGKPGVMILLDEDETEDRALRAATDTMDAGALRRAINEAQEAGHDSTALRTAKFVLQHLTDTRSLPGPKNPLELPPPTAAAGSDSKATVLQPPVRAVTPPPADGLRAPGGSAPGGKPPLPDSSSPPSRSALPLNDGTTPQDDEADDRPPESAAGSKRLPMIHEGSPQLFDSWTNPASVPESLAPLLPPARYSTIFHAIPPEIESPRQAAQRFDEIIALGDPRFHPRNFPIGVVAYNRPVLLRQCLESLLSTPGVTLEQVTVYQDGEDEAVAQAARDLGVRVSQHRGNANQPGQEGAMQIARHYLWVLRSLFADNPAAAFGILVEDDMIFSPDFMLYFTQMAPVYERDPTVYAISSWNDNAQSRVTTIDPATGKPRVDQGSTSVPETSAGLGSASSASSPLSSPPGSAAVALASSLDPTFSSLALDPRMALRTDFFIGLGWMISRALFEKELQPKWPQTHWDHWMRDPVQRRNRQTIYPEVARNYNTGRKGTHSDEGFYRKYFEGIVWNQQAAVWMGSVTTRLIAGAYEPWLMARLHSAAQISSPLQFAQYTYSDLVLFIDMRGLDDPRWEKVYAPYFGLFHSQPLIRGIYKDSVVYTRWRSNYLWIILSCGSETFVKIRKEAETKVMTPAAFQSEGNTGEIRVYRAIPRVIDGVGAKTAVPSPSPLPLLGSASESCTDVCRRRSLRRGRKVGAPQLVCTAAALARINDCDSMQRHFACAKCEGNWGTDQPAYVHNPALPNYGSCLINSIDPDCDGSHPDTTRLCACVKKI